jgi:hypothetical protein
MYCDKISHLKKDRRKAPEMSAFRAIFVATRSATRCESVSYLFKFVALYEYITALTDITSIASHDKGTYLMFCLQSAIRYIETNIRQR